MTVNDVWREEKIVSRRPTGSAYGSPKTIWPLRRAPDLETKTLDIIVSDPHCPLPPGSRQSQSPLVA
jgi:hypothetical protein